MGDLQNMLRMVGYGENLGSGFPLILEAWKQSGWGEPELKSKIELDEVELDLPIERTAKRASESGKKSSKKSDKKSSKENEAIVLMTINSNSSATLFEIHKITNLSVSGVRKIIERLREQGMIKRIGPDKGGHWEILRNEIGINGNGSL